MIKFKLAWPLGPYGEVDNNDVHAIKVALNQLGYYTPPPMIGIQEMREPALFDALNKFQRDNDIPPTTYIMPYSPTVYALDKALKAQNPIERYVWRTVQDNRVRDSHAAREGQVFLRSQPPEGGNPGEDFNCRCWVEAVIEPNSKQHCINLWNSLQAAEKHVNEIKNLIDAYTNYIAGKKQEIEKLYGEILDIAGLSLDIGEPDMNKILKLLDKIISRAELAINIARLLDIRNKIEKLNEEINGMKNRKANLEKELENAREERDRIVEEFGISCPNFFNET